MLLHCCSAKVYNLCCQEVWLSNLLRGQIISLVQQWDSSSGAAGISADLGQHPARTFLSPPPQLRETTAHSSSGGANEKPAETVEIVRKRRPRPRVQQKTKAMVSLWTHICSAEMLHHEVLPWQIGGLWAGHSRVKLAKPLMLNVNQITL